MGSVHQLKVTLKGTKPPVWRRLQVPSAATLEDLHQVICAAFDWHGGHLHEFDAGGARFGEPHPDDYVAVEDERRVTLGRLAPAAGDTFDYLYDFGDSWEHRILVEKVMRPDAPQFHAVCLGGRRAAPPDDCGGVWGYEELLQILADPTHPEHHHYLEWAGGALDPESLSAGEVTRSLRYLAIGAPNATARR
jgi:hypothetical protein